MAIWVFRSANEIEHLPTGAAFRTKGAEWRLSDESWSLVSVVHDNHEISTAVRILELECTIWAYGRKPHVASLDSNTRHSQAASEELMRA